MPKIQRVERSNHLARARNRSPRSRRVSLWRPRNEETVAVLTCLMSNLAIGTFIFSRHSSLT